MVDKSVSSKNLLMYIGLVFLLTGAVAARGPEMLVVLLGGIAILALEVIDFKSLPPERSVIAQVILGSTLLLVSIIKSVESIGSRFTTNHFYMMILLIGLILVLIEDLKRYMAAAQR